MIITIGEVLSFKGVYRLGVLGARKFAEILRNLVKNVKCLYLR